MMRKIKELKIVNIVMLLSLLAVLCLDLNLNTMVRTSIIGILGGYLSFIIGKNGIRHTFLKPPSSLSKVQSDFLIIKMSIDNI